MSPRPMSKDRARICHGEASVRTPWLVVARRRLAVRAQVSPEFGREITVTTLEDRLEDLG